MKRLTLTLLSKEFHHIFRVTLIAHIKYYVRILLGPINTPEQYGRFTIFLGEVVN